VSFFSGLLGAKRLELLRTLIAKSDVLAVLLNPNSGNAAEQLKDAQQAARALAVQLHVFIATRVEDFETVFTAIVERKVDALMVGSDALFTSQRGRLTALASRHKLPTVYVERDFVEAGGLMSYGASLVDSYHQVGVYVGKILKGEKPADLPVLQPTKFDLVINLKVAKALGLTVPDKLIALADEVIE
jgi:putative ABC transport system substrate-binding protein